MILSEALRVADVNNPADRAALADLLEENGRQGEAALLRSEPGACVWDGRVYRANDVWAVWDLKDDDDGDGDDDPELVEVHVGLAAHARDAILAGLAVGRWRSWVRVLRGVPPLEGAAYPPFADNMLLLDVLEHMESQGLVETRDGGPGRGLLVRRTAGRRARRTA